MIDSCADRDAAPRDKTADLQIIYDGACPFCSTYARLIRLRESVGKVELLDARQHPNLATHLSTQGVDLNQTMVVRYGDQTYAGADAIQMLSLLSSGSGTANRLLAHIFRDEKRARRLYPWLRAGRNLTLRLLGRDRLSRSD